MRAVAAVHSDLESTPDDAASSASALLLDSAGIPPALFARTGLAETLNTVVGLARRIFHCDGAGVITADRCGFAVVAASAAEVARADALQIEHHQGPGFDTFTEQRPIISPELGFDSRWRFWAPQVADLGFRSVLSMVLADGDPFGAVTLYSRRPSFFPIEPLARQLGFAQQVSLAIAVAVEREHLVRARDSRGIIGQAQGILMERHQMTAEEAFAALRRYSSHLNLKLRIIAERIVSDRRLPELNP